MSGGVGDVVLEWEGDGRTGLLLGDLLTITAQRDTARRIGRSCSSRRKAKAMAGDEALPC